MVLDFRNLKRIAFDQSTHREISLLNFVKSNQIWIAITNFQTDLAPKKIQFGAKSIGNMQLQSVFGLVYRDDPPPPLAKHGVQTGARYRINSPGKHGLYLQQIANSRPAALQIAF